MQNIFSLRSVRTVSAFAFTLLLATSMLLGGAAPAFASINGITVGTQAPNPVTAGNSATYSVTTDATGSNHDTKITAVSGLPTGAAFSSDCVVSNSSASTHNTVTVTTNAATTPAGTSNLTLTIHMYSSSNGSCTGSGTGSDEDTHAATLVVAAAQPDLTVTKTNDTSNATENGYTYNWSLAVANSGTTATFSNGQTLLVDNLPSLGATYGTAVLTNNGSTGTINCTVSGNDLTCTASGTVTIPSTKGFSVSVPVTATAVGSLVNPRTGGVNTCKVDPNGNITESNEGNNTCANTVTVATNEKNIVSATVGGGSSVTVAPGATISTIARLTSTGSGTGNDWFGTSWAIGTTPPGATTCVNTAPDYNTAQTNVPSNAFNITAPATPGTYNLYLIAKQNDDCTGLPSPIFTLANAVIVKADQTITFGALGGKTYGDADFTVSATGGASGNPVTFASQTTGVCTTSGTNGSTVHIVAQGTCTIRASQAGNGSYNAAPNVDQSFTVAKKTLTAALTGTVSKVYNGNTTATLAVGNYSLPGVLGGDTVNLNNPTSGTYDTATVGTGKTVSVSGLSISGASSGNYVLSSTNVSGPVGTITKANTTTTVTCPASVTYNGSAQTPCSAAVTSADGLNLTGLTPTYSNNTNAGTASASYTYIGDTNHNGSSDSKNFTIGKADAVIVVTPYSVTYDSNAHTAAGSATGVTAEDLSSLLHLGGTTHTDAGTYNGDAWTFDGDANYNSDSGTVDDAIATADATCTVDGYTGVYDAAAHGATGSCTGVDNETLAGLDLGASFTDVPGGTAHWVFTDVTGNYNNDAGDVAINIGKADADITVTPYNVVYDGSEHLATGSATGVNSEDLSSDLDLSSTAHTNVGNFSDAWSFIDSTGNYNDASDSVNDIITAADTTTTLTCPVNVTYNGLPQEPCTAEVIGAGGLDEDITADIQYSDNTDAGTASASVSYVGDVNHNASSDDTTFTIDQADANITVTGYSVTYDGGPHTAGIVATGAQGEDLSADVDLSATTHTAASTYNGDAWSFSDPNGNYADESGTVDDLISQADATISIDGYTGVYDAAVHGASINTATGVNSEDLSADIDLGESFTDVPGGTAHWTFHDPSGNYADESGDASIVITAKDADISVTPYNIQYDGSDHGATGSATGVGSEDLSSLLDLSATHHTNVGNYNDTWTFHDPAGNYTDASAQVNDVITIAGSVTTVSCPASVTYNGSAQEPCTASYTTDDGLSGSLTVGYTNNTNVGTANASASYAGDANHTGSSDAKTFAIDQQSLVVAADTGTKVFGQGDPALTYHVVSGLQGTDTAGSVLSGNLARDPGENVGNYNITKGTLAANGNYDLSFSGNVFSITQASLGFDIAPLSQVYDGSPKPVTVTTDPNGVAVTVTYDLSATAPTAVGDYAVHVESADANYSGSANTTLHITPAEQTITVDTSAPPAAVYNGHFTVAAHSNTGNPVAITTSGICTGSGSDSAEVIVTSGTGTCTVHYNVAADSNHTAATEVTENVSANKAFQDITFTNPGAHNFGDADFALSATGGFSGNDVTFTSDTTSICTVSGSTLHIVAVGTCSVTANQAGNDNFQDATPNQQSFSITDNTAPVITLNGANPQVIEKGAAYSELGASASDDVDGDISGSIVIDASAVDTNTVGDYSVTYNVEDSAHNAADTVTRTVQVRDTTAPPAPVIDTHPTNPSNTTALSFTFHDTEAGVTLLCAVDADSFADCSAGSFSGNTIDGDHTFHVKAKDASNNESSEETFTWTVDTEAPTVSITSGPQDPTPTQDNTPSFTFSTSDGTTVCSVDGGASAPCTSPFTVSPALTDGTHTVTVTATDAAGNSGSDSRTFTVDTQGPVVTITSPSGSDTGTTPADATFTVDGPATVSCDLDGTVTNDCTSPFALGTLGGGSHTFTVTATDAAGNSGSDSVTWTVDATGPDVQILTGPADGSTVESDSGEFTFDDPNTDAAHFFCTLDGSAEVACDAGIFAFGPLSDASHTFTVYAKDSFGNAGDAVSRTWTVDAVGPVISNQSATSPTDTTITVTWDTDEMSTSRVVYDTSSHASVGAAPNYGYAASTIEDSTLTTHHVVVVSGLSNGTTYYFRGVSHGSPETVSDEVSNTTTTPAPTNVTVTIVKYVDGSAATAGNTNSASFPMHAVFPGGEGDYALSASGFNNPNPYQATTAEMPSGSNYSTFENEPTTCTGTNAWKLDGYKLGDTLEAALASATVADASFTNLQSSKFVIVENSACEVNVPTNIKVHIYKYLDGSLATPASANNYQFPMTATWMTANLNGGVSTSGDYVLGNFHGGNADQYGADTSPMNVPADYTTHEITDGTSNVLPIGATCAPGKYRLVGYSEGDTLQAALGATKTNDAPVYTDLGSDKYVVVWNETCGETPPPTSATVVATKIVCNDESDLPNAQAASHITDATTAAAFVQAHPSCHLQSGWQFEWGNENAGDPGRDFTGPAGNGYTTSGLTDGNGTVTMNVPLANLSRIDVREVLKPGYIPFTYDQSNQSNADNVSAELSCANDGLNYDNWEWITNPSADQTYYCVAWNVAKAPPSCPDGQTYDPESQQCVPNEPPPVENSCPAPSTLEGATITAMGASPSGEQSVQQILDGAGYSLNATSSETGYQVWNVTANTEVHISADYVAKYAGHEQTFGYYVNGDLGTFVPVFKTNAALPESVPLSSAGPFTITVPDGATTMGFAIRTYDNGSLAGTRATQNSLNGGSDQVAVYNPVGNGYVLAFEDLVNGDNDYNDLVVRVDLSCETVCVPHEATTSFVSDVATTDNSLPAVILSVLNSRWTASIPGANWIWNSEPAQDADASAQDVQTFTRTFTVDGTPTGASLDIAADNGYSVQVNGHDVCADATEFNYQASPADDASSGQDTCVIPAEDLVTGANTITFTVTNMAQSGGTWASNPAGLLYKVTVNSTTCDDGGDNGGGPDCGPGTHADGDACVPDDTQCSPSQHLVGDTCVATPQCDVHEHLNQDQDACIADDQPTCDAGFHAEDYECVADAPESPQDICPNIEGTQTEVPNKKVLVNGLCLPQAHHSRGGGGGGGNFSSGQVLGASTCSPLITDYLKLGWNNNPDQVKKLQDFLNTQLGLSLNVSGIFDQATENAVKQFQQKYWDLVLKPWFGLPGSGISGANTPTGFVYQTTKWQINNLFCAGSESFPATLN